MKNIKNISMTRIANKSKLFNKQPRNYTDIITTILQIIVSMLSAKIVSIYQTELDHMLIFFLGACSLAIFMIIPIVIKIIYNAWSK